MRPAALVLALAVPLIGCGSAPTAPGSVETCEGFGDWQSSPYVGTPVYAARAGLVTQVEESHIDGQVAATGFDNPIVIQHDDGITTLYGHLTHDGR